MSSKSETYPRDIELDIADVLMEKPVGFSFRGHHYNLYPLCIGTMQLLSRFLVSHNLDKIKDSHELYLQLLWVLKSDFAACIRVISYLTLKGAECLDECKVKKRFRRLVRMKEEDVATLLVTAILSNKTELICKHYKIDIENKNVKRISKEKAKNDNSSVSFGGKSIWGSVIDAACHRYGWTFQYVIWGISLTNLQLLLYDQIKTIYLDKKERKKMHISTDGVTVRASEKQALQNVIDSNNWK